MTTEKPRMIALWGSHRRPIKGVQGLPSNLDKGIQELSELGHEIISIYPLMSRETLPPLVAKLLKGKALYKTAILDLLQKVKKSDVLYTTDKFWCGHISWLKRWSLLKNRFIFKWSGFDAPWADMARGEASFHWRHYRDMISGADFIYLPSENECRLLRDHYPQMANRVFFSPTAVDIGFYQEYSSLKPAALPYFVAVGSDQMRDWPFIFKLAARGMPLKIVTDDVRVKRVHEELNMAWPESLTLEFNVGFARSAELMAQSSGLIISTLPNERFSGSTTVGVAAALGKPLVLDEQYDLQAYGLHPGKNCEWFERGDVDAAYGILTRLLQQKEYAAQLGSALKELAPRYDTVTGAKLISAACYENVDLQAAAQGLVGG
jgi:hypothetical protein